MKYQEVVTRGNLQYIGICSDLYKDEVLLRTPKIDVRRMRNFLQSKRFESQMVECPENPGDIE